jgi:hypothetical protein
MTRFQYKSATDDYILFGVVTFFGLVSIPVIESMRILRMDHTLRFTLYMAIVYVPFIPYVYWRSKNVSYGVALFAIGAIMPIFYNLVRANSSSMNFTVFSLFAAFVTMNVLVIRHFVNSTNLQHADKEFDSLKDQDLSPMETFFTDDEIRLKEFDSPLFSLKNQPGAVGQMLYSRESSYLLSKIRRSAANEDIYFLEGNDNKKAILVVNPVTRATSIAVYPDKNSESHKIEIVNFLREMQTLQLS